MSSTSSITCVYKWYSNVPCWKFNNFSIEQSSFDGDFEGNHVWLLGAIINHQGYSDLPMIYPWFTHDLPKIQSVETQKWLILSLFFFSQACGEEEVEAVEMAEVHRGSIDCERYGKKHGNTWKLLVKLLNYKNNICIYIYIMLSLLSVTRCQDILKDDVELLNIVQLRVSRCIAVWLWPPNNLATFWCLELSKCRKFMCQCCLFWSLFDKHCLNSTILCGCHNPEMYHLRKARGKLVADGMPSVPHWYLWLAIFALYVFHWIILV